MPPALAKVVSANRQQPLRLRGRNWSKCPLGDLARRQAQTSAEQKAVNGLAWPVRMHRARAGNRSKRLNISRTSPGFSWCRSSASAQAPTGYGRSPRSPKGRASRPVTSGRRGSEFCIGLQSRRGRYANRERAHCQHLRRVGLRRRGWPLFRLDWKPPCGRCTPDGNIRPHPAAMAEMQKLLNRLIAKHTRSPADWRPAMARGSEGQPEYGDIIQAAIGDRAAPRHGYGATEYLAYVVLNGGHA